MYNHVAHNTREKEKQNKTKVEDKDFKDWVNWWKATNEYASYQQTMMLLAHQRSAVGGGYWFINDVFPTLTLNQNYKTKLVRR